MKMDAMLVMVHRQEIRECLCVWRRIADEGNDRRARDGYGECMNACDFTIIWQSPGFRGARGEGRMLIFWV